MTCDKLNVNELSKKLVHEYHSFDVWRRITNQISIEVGDLNDLPEDLQALVKETNCDKHSLAYALKVTYDTTQERLRHILIKSIGMS